MSQKFCITDRGVLILTDLVTLHFIEFAKHWKYFLVRAEWVRARADVVVTKLGIIGANVVRAHARFLCEGRRSGH